MNGWLEVAGTVYINGPLKAVIWREHSKCWGYSVWFNDHPKRKAFGNCISRTVARRIVLDILSQLEPRP